MKPVKEADYEVMRRFVRKVSRPEGFISEYVCAALREELTFRQKETVYLYYIEQRSMRETARILGVSTQSVSKTLQRARRKLGRYLRYTGLMAEND